MLRYNLFIMERKLVEVTRVPGLLNGDMLKIFLESKGINAMVIQESAGKTFGLTVDGLGHARVYVPEDQVKETEEILAALERGDFELQEGDSSPDSNPESNQIKKE
jgi:hypothetical protein